MLHEENRLSIMEDLNKRPVGNISGKASQEEIISVLSKYGISSNRVEIWGSGKPLREFLWSEEMADACVFIMENVNFEDLKTSGTEIRNTHINIGTGSEISIRALAELIAGIVGFEGHFYFNGEKPDGAMRKLTDVKKLNSLGWKHKIDLETGIDKLYKWYIDN